MPDRLPPISIAELERLVAERNALAAPAAVPSDPFKTPRAAPGRARPRNGGLSRRPRAVDGQVNAR